MNKFLKWSLIGVLLIIVLPVVFFFGKVFISSITSPYAPADAYHEYIHDQIGVKILIPNDCTDEYKISNGMQCKSSVYTFEKGQKEGYLLTVAAKEVTERSTINLKGEIIKTISAEDAWREDMKSLCKTLICNETTFQGNPAFETSLFSSGGDLVSFNGESLYVFRRETGVQYVLSVRAAKQTDATLILHYMENGLSWISK